jgi:hypothetical protein
MLPLSLSAPLSGCPQHSWESAGRAFRVNAQIFSRSRFPFRTVAAILAGVLVTLIVVSRKSELWALIVAVLYVVDVPVRHHWSSPATGWDRLWQSVDLVFPAVVSIAADFITARLRRNRGNSGSVAQPSAVGQPRAPEERCLRHRRMFDTSPLARLTHASAALASVNACFSFDLLQFLRCYALLDVAKNPVGTPIDLALLGELIALRTIVANLIYAFTSEGRVTAEQMRAFIERADGTKGRRAAELLSQLGRSGTRSAEEAH